MPNETIFDKMTKSEKEVADFLTEFGIWWNLKHPVVVYDDEDLQRNYYPDFYLSEYGVYLEVCGSEKFDYEFRSKIYYKNHIKVIFVHTYKDKRKWKEHLIDKLATIEVERFSMLTGLFVGNLFGEDGKERDKCCNWKVSSFNHRHCE